jgi:uncharacterized protein YuzE
MRIQYFADTDTLYIVLNDRTVAETRDLDENTLYEIDDGGELVSLTIEHASTRVDVTRLSYEQVPTPKIHIAV